MELIDNGKSPKLIAFYLPQFHRLKFNDDYWGKGFTEWTNTAKAKPLFKGHYQPHIPADLGFYDLSVPSIRKEQAELAKTFGIDGFCYWHYWFGENREVMDMPFKEVVRTKEPDFPFCLAWANHDWHNVKTHEVIIKQCYEGEKDYKIHFYSLLDAFRDNRYIRINGKPLFLIFDPIGDIRIKEFMSCWSNLCKKEGLLGFYFIAMSNDDISLCNANKYEFSGHTTFRLRDFLLKQDSLTQHIDYLYHKLINPHHVYNYSKVSKYFISEAEKDENIFPTIVTGWDHTPRSGEKALILSNYNPKTFEAHVRDVFNLLKKKRNKIAFVRSWNEWAEGNHLEPDLKYGLQFLEKIKELKTSMFE